MNKSNSANEELILYADHFYCKNIIDDEYKYHEIVNKRRDPDDPVFKRVLFDFSKAYHGIRAIEIDLHEGSPCKDWIWVDDNDFHKYGPSWNNSMPNSVV